MAAVFTMVVDLGQRRRKSQSLRDLAEVELRVLVTPLQRRMQRDLPVIATVLLVVIDPWAENRSQIHCLEELLALVVGAVIIAITEVANYFPSPNRRLS